MNRDIFKANKGPLHCRHCGKELLDDSRFCAHCGTSTSPEGDGRSDRDSGTSDGKSDIYQGTTGSAFFGTEVRLAHESERSIRTALIMGFFFGAFGGHNFYLGNLPFAIAKIIMTLIGLSCIPVFWSGQIGLGFALLAVLGVELVWNIVEFILIANGEFKDKDGKPLHKNL